MEKIIAGVGIFQTRPAIGSKKPAVTLHPNESMEKDKSRATDSQAENEDRKRTG